VTEFVNNVLLVVELKKVVHPEVEHSPASKVEVKGLCVSCEKSMLV
jgi:hypothetical protein